MRCFKVSTASIRRRKAQGASSLQCNPLAAPLQSRISSACLGRSALPSAIGGPRIDPYRNIRSTRMARACGFGAARPPRRCRAGGACAARSCSVGVASVARTCSVGGACVSRMCSVGVASRARTRRARQPRHKNYRVVSISGRVNAARKNPFRVNRVNQIGSCRPRPIALAPPLPELRQSSHHGDGAICWIQPR